MHRGSKVARRIGNFGESTDRAAEFVAATLGPLAADTDTAQRLRETLRIYIAEGGHAPRTAAQLFAHRNTVLQRVNRATAMLGHPISERRLAVALALELTHHLGSRVLSG